MAGEVGGTIVHLKDTHILPGTKSRDAANAYREKLTWPKGHAQRRGETMHR
jgi:hypothetical protein